MNIKKIVCALLSVVTLLGAVCSTGFAEAAPELVIQVGHVDVEQLPNHSHFMALEFARRVKELSGGKIEIQVKGNSQLGGEVDMLEGMQIGTIDMAIITSHAFAPYTPELQLFDLPYLFEDNASAWKLLESDLTKELDAKLLANTGIHILGRGEQGFRLVVNNVRPIRTPADIAGVKIRVPETAIYTDAFKCEGANPTPMAWSEVYTGVQQGTVDGIEVSPLVFYPAKMYEQLKYISMTRHVFAIICLCVADNAWSSYTPEQQAILQQAADETSVAQRAYIAEEEGKCLADMEAYGCLINDDVDRKAFREIVQPVYDKYLPQIGEAYYERAMEIMAAE